MDLTPPLFAWNAFGLWIAMSLLSMTVYVSTVLGNLFRQCRLETFDKYSGVQEFLILTVEY